MSDAQRQRTRPGAGELLRRHWLLAIFLGAGVVLRLICWFAYWPALLYIDSFRYVGNLYTLHMNALNPIGYDLILLPLLTIGSLFGGGLAFTAAVQHLVGLLIALALYAMARQLGAARWVAALVTVPTLLDGYRLQIEQNIMAEIWSDLTLVAAVWLLLSWRRRQSAAAPNAARAARAAGAGLVGRLAAGPHWWPVAIAGGLIAFNGTIRIIGLVALLPFVAYLIFAGARWKDPAWRRQMFVRVTAGLAGFAVVLGMYAIAYRATAGYWGLTGASSGVLYGRTATVAECDRLPLKDYMEEICPDVPVEDRLGVDAYTHGGYEVSDPPPGLTTTDIKKEFGWLVMREQPFDVAGAILQDFLKGFAWGRVTSHNDVPLHRWQFQIDYPRWEYSDANQVTQYFDGTDPHTIPALTAFMRGYQLGVGYVPGTLLGIAGLLGAAGVFVRRSGMRAEALLVTGIGFVLLFGAACFEFSWRYQLPGMVFLPLAGAIGFTALTGRRRTPLGDYPDAIDQQAKADFRDQHGTPNFGELTVVIAAYNEEHGIGHVLDRMPRTLSTPSGEELGVSVLVVVDGSTDRTAEIARAHGAFVCVAPQNRGQGGALRLGYRMASEHGAHYIVTTDADGQYDIAELDDLMRPLLTGEADFVTGSRRLGLEEADSRVRWLGVRVFATLASVLTAQRITDTSFGFRAMHARLADRVTLTEPQYQASELLLGVMAMGARVVEVPLSMRLRNSGASKKGGSIVYGANYARVMLSTWWREWFLGGNGNRDLRRTQPWRRPVALDAGSAAEDRDAPRKTNRSSNVNLKKKTTP